MPAILYESDIHPSTILTGLPSAVVGALPALRPFGMDSSSIAVIGRLMLVGMVKKNAKAHPNRQFSGSSHRPPPTSHLQRPGGRSSSDFRCVAGDGVPGCGPPPAICCLSRKCCTLPMALRGRLSTNTYSRGTL